MAANASPRAVRNEVLGSLAADFAGYRLALDCGNAKCGGERAFDISAIVALRRRPETVGAIVQHLRCQRCGARPRSVYLETGPEIAGRGRFRRVALVGAEAR